MMRKIKFLSVFVLLALLLSAGPGAVMAQEPPPQSLPQVANGAVLTNNETGQRFELPVTTQIKVIGPDAYKVQYQVEIPTAILRGDYDEKSKIDPTCSARVTIHQNYSEKYIGGIPYVAVYYYKGKWERLDPAVSCTKLNVVASCWGEDEHGGGVCQQERIETRTVLDPGNGTWYQKTPSWTGKYIKVNELGWYQGGTTKVYLKRGSTTWTFEVTVIQQGL
jgi:hypothetical protein